MREGKWRIPDPNDFMGRLKGTLKQGIPGLRETMQPRLNALGDEVEEANPFVPGRRIKRNDVLESMIRVGQGPSKPKREAGTTATEYNETMRATGAKNKEMIEGLRTTIEGRSDPARRAIYARATDPRNVARAEKLSDETKAVEVEIDTLAADAISTLTQSAEFRKLDSRKQAAARKLITEEMKAYRGKAGSTDRLGRVRQEKAAQLPDWTPDDLAKAAMDSVRD